MICDNMVFEGNRKLIIDELLKETELIPIEDLKKRLKIINPKIDRSGIDRDHLVPLTKEGVIEYGSSPKQRTNKPPKSVDAVRIATTIEALRQLIAKYPDIIELQSSTYCQSMIAPPLLREIEKLWGIKEPYKSEKEFNPLIDAYYKQYRENQAERSKNYITKLAGISVEDNDYIYSDDDETDERGPRAHYYMRPDFFTEEDVLIILKMSPTALQKALNGTPINEEPSQILPGPTGTLVPNITVFDTFSRAYFQEMLLASLILDSGTHHYPNHHFEPKLSIEISFPGGRRLKKTAGMIKDHSTFQPIVLRKEIKYILEKSGLMDKLFNGSLSIKDT